MPYRQCPECGITFHSVGGYASTSTCSVCGTELPAEAKRFPGGASGVRRKFAREPIAAAAARRALASIREAIEEELYETAALLVTELIANSVLHAGPDAGDHLVLDVAVMPDRLRVEVRDRGAGFVRTPRPVADPLAMHWGLHIVETLASRWDVESGHGKGETVVWFELDRENPS